MSTRDGLVARATELGCFDNPEDRTDGQLRSAIEAEEAAGAWLARVQTLPPDQASAAFRRLGQDLLRGAGGSDVAADKDAEIRRRRLKLRADAITAILEDADPPLRLQGPVIIYEDNDGGSGA